MKKIGLLLGLLNTVAIAGVLGFFVYTKVLYKHPPITEAKERQKLVDQGDKPSQAALTKATIDIDPITANLDPYNDADGKQKIHFVSLTIAVEIRDVRETAKFEAIKPVFMDRVLQTLSKKKFEELNQVQGRYVFRSQVIDAANEFLGAPVVSEIYFSEFLLQ
jgi:flagellar basal body-associated protein FliL